MRRSDCFRFFTSHTSEIRKFLLYSPNDKKYGNRLLSIHFIFIFECYVTLISPLKSGNYKVPKNKRHTKHYWTILPKSNSRKFHINLFCITQCYTQANPYYSHITYLVIQRNTKKPYSS